MVRTAINLV